MNKRKQVTFAAITAVAITTFAAAKPAVTVTASLRDGSTIRGDFLTKKITGETLFEKNLALAPSLVRSINFSGTNGESKVELSNGDHFAMTVSNDVFADPPRELPLAHTCVPLCHRQGRFFRRTRLLLHIQLAGRCVETQGWTSWIFHGRRFYEGR